MEVMALWYRRQRRH